MRRFGMVLVVGALLLAVTAGLALAAVRIGDSGSNTLTGTTGDSTGQDVLLGFAGVDNLTGKSAADYLWGGSSDDTLQGGNGDDVLDGGSGEDTISTHKGFDVVYAKDPDGTSPDNRDDTINCNDEGGYFIVNWDPEDTDIDDDGDDMCPGAFDPSAARVAAASDEGSEGGAYQN